MQLICPKQQLKWHIGLQQQKKLKLTSQRPVATEQEAATLQHIAAAANFEEK